MKEPGILRTSQQLRDEGLPIFYEANTFGAENERYTNDSMIKTTKFVESFCKQGLSHLGKVYVHWPYICGGLESALVLYSVKEWAAEILSLGNGSLTGDEVVLEVRANRQAGQLSVKQLDDVEEAPIHHGPEIKW